MTILKTLPTTPTYSVVYADPPWRFETYSSKGKRKSPEKHYVCMSVPDICRLPVNDLCLGDCTLLLWTTAPFLRKAFEVIDAWGFTYKTVGFCWAKLNIRSLSFFTGCGYWTRANAEYCLLATKGKPHRVSKGINSLLVTPRREHSRKPEEAYERIEGLLDGPYIELFARHGRQGWDSWGDELQQEEGT